MTFALSRLMSTATASYGAYALVNPRHLGDFVDPSHARSYDTLAYTYGARDLITSAVALKGKSEKTVSAAMVIRILSDLSDAAILSKLPWRPQHADLDKIVQDALAWERTLAERQR